MSQIGMQMPGRQRSRAPSINVYTGILFCAVVCLAGALYFAAQAALTVGPEGGFMEAMKVHPEGDVRLDQ